MLIRLNPLIREMLRLKMKPKSFLIQPMLKGDLELIAGIVRDPQFGPAAMLGLGGVWAEVYKDVVFRLVPLNKEEILEMVSDLKGQALLKGYRGSKPVNMESLADWLIKLGWLALKFEKIQEIDVNPLLIVRWRTRGRRCYHCFNFLSFPVIKRKVRIPRQSILPQKGEEVFLPSGWMKQKCLHLISCNLFAKSPSGSFGSSGFLK